MTLAELKLIIDKEIKNGNADAIIEVQDYADHITGIIITKYEGCGLDCMALHGKEPFKRKIFSLISD